MVIYNILMDLRIVKNENCTDDLDYQSHTNNAHNEFLKNIMCQDCFKTKNNCLCKNIHECKIIKPRKICEYCNEIYIKKKIIKGKNSIQIKWQCPKSHQSGSHCKKCMSQLINGECRNYDCNCGKDGSCCQICGLMYKYGKCINGHDDSNKCDYCGMIYVDSAYLCGHNGDICEECILLKEHGFCPLMDEHNKCSGEISTNYFNDNYDEMDVTIHDYLV
ncbi:hypothetical protein qu_700 [Acanthamoeba polyphaga mimivirus]|nr:hypothetical protein [Mimivirus reunion]WMV62034.1 hypothetical protein qu_700 [Mimivirus sp.]WMV63011.1 hypothetical protein qu_700 [Acanthamoeba polyphaga mimivirus]WMV63988.1 hypothetical protein qu_700 [Mimivirus sp.]